MNVPPVASTTSCWMEFGAGMSSPVSDVDVSTAASSVVAPVSMTFSVSEVPSPLVNKVGSVRSSGIEVPRMPDWKWMR